MIFLDRLGRAPPCASADEAFRLIETLLGEVEDSYSGISYDPTRPRNDGRLYPPSADSGRRVLRRPRTLRYRTATHNTYVAANGAILIATVGPPKVTLIDKPGLNGEQVRIA